MTKTKKKKRAVKEKPDFLPTNQCEPQSELSAAYWAGFDACKRGQEETDSPYPVDSQDDKDWYDGWVDFYFDIEKGE
jgi:hypothetical protein